MKVETLSVGMLKTNCYLVYQEPKREALIIDPGDDAEYIAQRIIDLSLRPRVLVATHGHFDHILAVTFLKLSLGIPFAMHPKDKFLLSRMVSSARRYTGAKVDPASAIDNNLEDETKLGFLDFEVILTPGHTPGSVVLYSKKENVAFVGDLIFEDGSLGRYDFKYSDFSKLEESVGKVLALPPNTLIYPGHGKRFRVSTLKIPPPKIIT